MTITTPAPLPGPQAAHPNLNEEAMVVDEATEPPPVELDGATIRWAKIQQLRQQIAAGTYSVSSLELASRMIDAMMR